MDTRHQDGTRERVHTADVAPMRETELWALRREILRLRCLIEAKTAALRAARSLGVIQDTYRREWGER